MKRKIRKELIDLRNGKSGEDLEELSREISRRLFLTPEFKKAKTVMFYVSTGSEVRTESMIKEAMKLGKKIAVPAVELEEHALKVCELNDCDAELAPGAFGILEPKKECRRELPPADIDLVIVPGIAFDRKGVRIGYGKGFYDKLLPSMEGVRIIGLAFDFQILPEIPVEDHDVRVDKIITEKAVLRTSTDDN